MNVYTSVCVLALAWMTTGQTCGRNLPYEGHVLTVQWPITYCQSSGCNLGLPLRHWTLHGLWPQFAPHKSAMASVQTGSPFPQYCCHPQRFDPVRLQHLADLLTRTWPSLSGDSVRFWQHQWRKHGTCMRDPQGLSRPMSVEDYFGLVLNLTSGFPVARWLQAAGIRPSNTDTYTPGQILNSLESGSGRRGIFRLQCDLDPDTGVGLLKEIQICFNRQIATMPCARLFGEDSNRCSDRVVLLRI